MSYEKLRKASLNHAVNKKHMKFLKLLRVPRIHPPLNDQEASLQVGILSTLISNYKKIFINTEHCFKTGPVSQTPVSYNYLKLISILPS